MCVFKKQTHATAKTNRSAKRKHSKLKWMRDMFEAFFITVLIIVLHKLLLLLFLHHIQLERRCFFLVSNMSDCLPTVLYLKNKPFMQQIRTGSKYTYTQKGCGLTLSKFERDYHKLNFQCYLSKSKICEDYSFIRLITHVCLIHSKLCC